MQPFLTKTHATSPHTKSRNLTTQKNSRNLQKNQETSTHTKSCDLNKKIKQPLHKKNIARIEKRCPENITSVVKCTKLLFPKVLTKFKLFFLRLCDFFVERLHDFFHYCNCNDFTESESEDMIHTKGTEGKKHQKEKKQKNKRKRAQEIGFFGAK